MAVKKNTVRLIGGQWRGRKIDFPTVEGLRPTTDPIRETLFNWIQPYLSGANCLDLYTGSGALGFEAASRGAKRVLMVEKEITIIKSLRRNKDILQADQISLMKRSALDFLQDIPGDDSERFDVVFLDPPFNLNCLPACTQKLEQSGWLAGEAVIYVECERNLDLSFLPDNWLEHRRKTTGQVAYCLYIRE